MRLWSIHPKYLDPKGLVAVWREGLLALAVVKGATRGYRNHPQLIRFRAAADPVVAVSCYLRHVHAESRVRGYAFDAGKLPEGGGCERLEVTRGQLSYEMDHLRQKLLRRNPSWFAAIERVRSPEPHPLFVVVDGGVEGWERR